MTDKPSKPKSESDLLALRVPEPSAPADLFGVREDDDKSVRALRWLAQIVGSGRFREIQRCDGNDSVVDPLEPAAKARIARVLNRTADALRVHAACDDARCASCGCRKWEHESAQKQPKQDCLCMSCGGWLAAAPPVGGGWQAIESAPKRHHDVIDLWCVGEHDDIAFYCANYCATGRYINGYHEYQGRVPNVWWRDGAWRPKSKLRLHAITVAPTHWMPLPEPPK
jgi:hypothetical protein